jgi:arylsulfatase A-like enzyme
MSKVRNILFIMCDQLRWDYLSCYGHPTLHTPHIDHLAQRGVRFERAYVQSPVCGPSRMSFYTGRTVFSHGATWNFVPLPIGEHTLGDYLKPTGMRVALAGKTHMRADVAGMARLGLNRETDIGMLITEAGFEPYERDDGEHPDPIVAPDLRYNAWLKSLGYDGDNPWNSWANSAAGPNGELLSGWQLRNSRYPARIRAEHSETAYLTDRAISFIQETGERPWLLHLSYIKPHWPYMAPSPYHALYQQTPLKPVVRDASEREHPHPVYEAFMDLDPAQSFSRDEVRECVVPAYMGLVKQIDDNLGRLFAALEQAGRRDDTMIVFTSDHGDYLGDHWLGEKELFHEASVRVPLIIVDPDARSDATRGTVENRLVESLDLVPTFLEAVGVPLPTHRLEGRSLLPLLGGTEVTDWRDSVFSELDYGFYRARTALGREPNDCRCYMLRTARWKFIHYRGFRPQLFDLAADPDEFNDLGVSPAHADIRVEFQALLIDRLTARRNRVAMTDRDVVARTDGARKNGVIIGEW